MAPMRSGGASGLMKEGAKGARAEGAFDSGKPLPRKEEF